MTKKKWKMLEKARDWLLIAGALAWGGLVAFSFNIVETIGVWTDPIVATITYSLVGLSGVWALIGKFTQ